MPDAFDAIIESEVAESRRPKPTPPPGMVGTSSRSASRPRIAAHVRPWFASFFTNLGIGSAVVAVISALLVDASIADRIALAVSGITAGVITAAAGFALDRLDAVAHWSRVCAEAIHHGTASKND